LNSTLIHRHFSADKIRPNGRKLYSQAALDGGGAVLVHFHKAGTALADKCFQWIITQCRDWQKTITGTKSAVRRASDFVFDAGLPGISDNGPPFFENFL
jgi:hypothetical protein